METISLAAALEGLDPTARFARYRELWERAERYEVLPDFPLHLDIELSAVCNLKCRHCFQNGLLTGQLGFMPDELFCKIIDEGALSGLCAIKLQVRGESLLHPRFFECVTYAKAAGIMDVQLTTNATLLTDDKIEQVLESGLDGLIVSYDRHHHEASATYDYRFVEENILKVIDHRAKTGRTGPWLRIQASIEEGDREQIAAELRARFPEADSIAVNKIHIFDYDRESYPGLTADYDLLPCNYPMQRLVIYWNGDVTACCMDYNNQFDFGNVTTQTIHEIWNSEKLAKFRAMHSNGRREEVAVCNRCLVAISPKEKRSA